MIPGSAMYGVGFAWPDYTAVPRAMDGQLGALFRKEINEAGFYEEWRKKFGDQAWGVFEENVGKLS